jgi:dephospho-CoA kinase
MNYFIEHVVFSTDGAAFKSFVETFRDATNADDTIIRDELKNRITARAETLMRLSSVAHHSELS